MLRRIWDEGMNRSQTVRLMQTLTDSIGPRLTGTPQMTRGQDWLLATYTGWGIAARKEQYGTWLGWRRGGAMWRGKLYTNQQLQAGMRLRLP